MQRNLLVTGGKLLAGALSAAFIATAIEAVIDKGLALGHLAKYSGFAIVIALGIGAALWWLDWPSRQRETTKWPFIALAVVVIVCFVVAHFL